MNGVTPLVAWSRRLGSGLAQRWQQAATPVASDFSPGLLAIQESPPARLPRMVLYVVTTLCVILLIWAAFGKLDIIASAEGRLVPQTYVKVVQPADAGIVEAIFVKEGQLVQAGQVLLRMDRQVAEADARSIESDYAIRSLQLKRIDAELSDRPFLLTKDDHIPADLYSQVRAQYSEHRRAYEDALSQAQEVLKKAERDYESAVEVLAKLREVTPILKEQAEAYAGMGKDGYAPQVTVRDKQREYIEKVRDLSAQEATVAGLAASVAETRKRLSQVTSKYRSDLQNEKIEALAQYRKLREEQTKQTHKVGLLELRAPQTGIVKDLATHTIGSVVSPGTVLLTLVPEDEPLQAEIQIKNDDIGFVVPQQSAKVKVVAYPFEKYGMVEGEVIHVGPDASDADQAGNSNRGNGADNGRDRQSGTLNYKALVALKSQQITADGESFKLLPGMQVIAEIRQGRRTVLEYLLSPLKKTVHDSARER
jgi:hemolysin D